MLIELEPLMKAAQDIFKDLTNVMGLLEKNVTSAIKIKKKIRRQREIVKIKRVLNRLARMYEVTNIPMRRRMEEMAELVEANGSLPASDQYDQTASYHMIDEI